MKQLNLFVALLVLLFTAPAAIACKCLPSPPGVAYNQAKAVFIGTLLGGTETFTYGWGGKTIVYETGELRFRVEEVFKGRLDGEVIIKVPNKMESSCGRYGLPKNERYLIYAYGDRSSERTILGTDQCNRNATLDEKGNTEDLNFLRNLPPAGSGGTIRGKIDLDLQEASKRPMPGIKVLLRTEGNPPIQAITNQEGIFEAKGLRPGEYRIVPVAPTNYVIDRSIYKAILDDLGTVEVSYSLRIDGQITVRVFDSQGREYYRPFVQFQRKGTDRPVSGVSRAKEPPTGSSMAGLPPGEYIFYMDYRTFTQDSKNRYYYPGTFDPAKAKSISLGLAQKIKGIRFRLPAKIKLRTIEGQVVMEDGSPAYNVPIELTCPRNMQRDDYRPDSHFTSTYTDRQGRFRLNAFGSASYVVHAWAWKKGSQPENHVQLRTPLFQLEPGKDAKALRFVLSEKADKPPSPCP